MGLSLVGGLGYRRRRLMPGDILRRIRNVGLELATSAGAVTASVVLNLIAGR
jgi:hypothetical protein